MVKNLIATPKPHALFSFTQQTRRGIQLRPLLVRLFQICQWNAGLALAVATTVPCIIHLNALAEKDKDGKYTYIQETRLTMPFSQLLVALSILALEFLKLLPLPVLYSVFLFIGISSLPNIQFWQRFQLFFRQPSLYPQTNYTKYMKKARVHLYTVVQIFFILNVVATKPV